MFLRNLLLVGTLAAALSGCKSNPYCLNCGTCGKSCDYSALHELDRKSVV